MRFLADIFFIGMIFFEEDFAQETLKIDIKKKSRMNSAFTGLKMFFEDNFQIESVWL